MRKLRESTTKLTAPAIETNAHAPRNMGVTCMALALKLSLTGLTMREAKAGFRAAEPSRK